MKKYLLSVLLLVAMSGITFAAVNSPGHQPRKHPRHPRHHHIKPHHPKHSKHY